MKATTYELMSLNTARGVCPAFQWIGQDLHYCDNCGRAAWAHTHFETSRDDGRILRKIISRAAAHAMHQRMPL